MRRAVSWGLTPLVFTLLAAPAHGQALTRRDMSLQIARVMADAAIAACQKAGSTNITAAVVDRAGDLVLLHRSDTANPHNAELARRKAYTSRTFGMTTLQFRDRTVTGEFVGQRLLADVIPLGGGVPVRIGDELIGAIGLSGSPMQEVDEKCALAGIAAASSLLK
jgi:uncharacterized protein GlcG (DUF336 family)